MVSGKYRISPERSRRFAELSGDFNPLHIDPVHARRLQFGTRVVHGVHHLLETWERVQGRFPDLAALEVGRVEASFPGPVTVDREISYRATCDADRASVEIVAHVADQRVLSLRIFHAGGVTSKPAIAVVDAGYDLEAPVDPGFPPLVANATLPLRLSTVLAQRLFPELYERFGPAWLAQVVATTRIVGMHCPGLHSLFAGLDLAFGPGSADTPRAELRFTPGAVDQRFRRIRVEVEGPHLQGRLDTYYRPAPVAQPAFDAVAGRVPKKAFAGQRALVIGGSRGLGETAAKILAAGGAEVVITYRAGLAEAGAIAAQIAAGGGRCAIAEFDVAADDLDLEALCPPERPPTQILYFASPHIAANNTGRWDRALFDRFARCYVESFFAIATHCAAAAEARNAAIEFFYPSSIFIDRPEKGLAEYAAAKAAGEAIARQLSARYPGARFRCPRLPRMATDQTASIIPAALPAPLDVLLGELLPGPNPPAQTP